MRVKIKKWLSDYFIEIIIIITFMVITYGYEITNWTLTIDEEMHSYINRITSYKSWITEGRWGIGLFKLILPTYQILPFWNGFVAVFLLGIGAFWICKVTDWFKVGLMGHIIAIISFICMPVYSFYLMFDTYSVEVSIGIVLAVIGAYKVVESICYNRNWKHFMVGLLCTVYSVAIYQLLLQIYICIVCFGILSWIYYNENIRLKDILKKILMAIMILVFALVIYGVINAIFQSFIDKNEYIDNFFRWGYIEWSIVIKSVKKQLANIYFFPENLFVGGYVLYIAYVALIIVLTTMLVKCKKRRIGVTLCIIGGFFSISLGVIGSGGEIPLRTMQVIPIFVSLSLTLGAKIIGELINHKALKVLLLMSTLFIFLNQSARVVELFYSENNRQDRDVTLTNNIANAIQDLGYGICPEYPVVFVGYPKTQNLYLIKEELFSSSMLTSGQSWRIYKWFMMKGYNYLIPTDEQYQEVFEYIGDKPVWPEKASVFFWNDMIIVNF